MSPSQDHAIPTQVSLLTHGDQVSQKLLEWYSRNARDYPWRGPDDAHLVASRDPWRVLVSEVMLQQTQTDRVAKLIIPFLDRFPDVMSCAKAAPAELLRAWKGLGYNNRALRLREAAGQIVDRFEGDIPDDVEQLRSLPGIGRYTAEAILCFAFSRQVPLIEVNVVRILSRVFFGLYDTDDRMPEKQIHAVSSRLMPEGRAADWNQGLMDLGTLLCTARSPDCRSCPLRNECLSADRVDEVVLFHKVRRRRRREPKLLGRPVRLWRGEVVDLLRSEPRGLPIAEIIDRLLGRERSTRTTRDEFIVIIAGLGREGMIRKIDVVSEGGVYSETDSVELPT